MQQYEVAAAVRKGGKASARAKASTIPFDGSAWQDALLPGPAELLATAFAACTLKNVERFSEILSFQYKSASIRVVAEREEHPPRIVSVRYTLRIETGEPAPRVDLLHRNLRKFGTVYNTLAAACAVDGKIIVGDTATELVEQTHAEQS